jgi:hypothetical protein
MILAFQRLGYGGGCFSCAPCSSSSPLLIAFDHLMEIFGWENLTFPWLSGDFILAYDGVY